MAGDVEIPSTLGEGGAHLDGFQAPTLFDVLESIVLDLQDIRDSYNAHTHGGSQSAPTATSPPEAATVGTTVGS